MLPPEIVIRPFEYTDSDYAHLTRIKHAVWPEFPLTTEQYREIDHQRDGEYNFVRLVMERDGRPVALATFGDSAPARRMGKFNIHIEVDPAYSNAGLGGLFYDHILDALLFYQPQRIEAMTHETRPAGLRFLRKRGFQEVLRSEGWIICEKILPT